MPTELNVKLALEDVWVIDGIILLVVRRCTNAGHLKKELIHLLREKKQNKNKTALTSDERGTSRAN